MCVVAIFPHKSGSKFKIQNLDAFIHLFMYEFLFDGDSECIEPMEAFNETAKKKKHKIIICKLHNAWVSMIVALLPIQNLQRWRKTKYKKKTRIRSNFWRRTSHNFVFQLSSMVIKLPPTKAFRMKFFFLFSSPLYVYVFISLFFFCSLLYDRYFSVIYVWKNSKCLTITYGYELMFH